MRQILILGTFLLNGYARATDPAPSPLPEPAHAQTLAAEQTVDCNTQVIKTINRSAMFLNGAMRYCRLLDDATRNNCLEQAMAGSINLFTRSDRNRVSQVIRDYCFKAPKQMLSILPGQRADDEARCLRMMISELPENAPERAALAAKTRDDLFKALDEMK